MKDYLPQVHYFEFQFGRLFIAWLREWYLPIDKNVGGLNFCKTKRYVDMLSLWI